jgi:LPXTG-motif cell wall-anchored protein
MIQVHTREGIFGGGGYGGGLFDGSNMGFGGLGLSSAPTYTWRSGDTGTSVAKAITGNGNRWTELATANPAHKCTQYGFCAKVGDVVKLPASWVAAAPAPSQAPSDSTAAPVAPSSGGTSPPAGPAADPCFLALNQKSNIADDLQDALSTALTAAGYNAIPQTGVYDSATCGAMFKLHELGISFHPVLPSLPAGCTSIRFDLDCPNMVLPAKIADAPHVGPTTGKSSSATAWMLGGFVVAAVGAGLYMSKKRK